MSSARCKIAIGILKNIQMFLDAEAIYAGNGDRRMDEQEMNKYKVDFALRRIKKFLSEVGEEQTSGAYDSFLEWNGNTH